MKKASNSAVTDAGTGTGTDANSRADTGTATAVGTDGSTGSTSYTNSADTASSEKTWTVDATSAAPESDAPAPETPAPETPGSDLPVKPDVVSSPNPGDRWVGEGGAVPPEGHAPHTDPDGSDIGMPLLTQETIDTVLARWSDIQVGFVQDPAQAVRDAETLVDQLVATLARMTAERKDSLAVDRSGGEPTTEELRHAIRRYRSFISFLVPKQSVR